MSDLFADLLASIGQARELREPPRPTATCLCGKQVWREEALTTPVDLSAEDVALAHSEGIHPCRACHHGVHHGAMSVKTHYSATSTVRDHYHPECVDL